MTQPRFSIYRLMIVIAIAAVGLAIWRTSSTSVENMIVVAVALNGLAVFAALTRGWNRRKQSKSHDFWLGFGGGGIFTILGALLLAWTANRPSVVLVYVYVPLFFFVYTPTNTICQVVKGRMPAALASGESVEYVFNLIAMVLTLLLIELALAILTVLVRYGWSRLRQGQRKDLPSEPE